MIKKNAMFTTFSLEWAWVKSYIYHGGISIHQPWPDARWGPETTEGDRLFALFVVAAVPDLMDGDAWWSTGREFLRNSILVGGDWNMIFFPDIGNVIILTNSIIFQRGRLKPPTRIDSIESMKSMGYTWVIRQKNLRYHLVAFFLRSEKKQQWGIRRSSEASGDPTNQNMKWGYG